jgi:hypothetical protein
MKAAAKVHILKPIGDDNPQDIHPEDARELWTSNDPKAKQAIAKPEDKTLHEQAIASILSGSNEVAALHLLEPEALHAKVRSSLPVNQNMVRDFKKLKIFVLLISVVVLILLFATLIMRR